MRGMPPVVRGSGSSIAPASPARTEDADTENMITKTTIQRNTLRICILPCLLIDQTASIVEGGFVVTL